MVKKLRQRKNRVRGEARKSRRVVRAEDMSIKGEVQYVRTKAEAGEDCVVTLGQLVLFSTRSGDAWLLDPADGLAACVARGGDSVPVDISEDSSTVSIGWTAAYRLDGDVFHVRFGDRSSRSIVGYPVRQIRDSLRRNQGGKEWL